MAGLINDLFRQFVSESTVQILCLTVSSINIKLPLTSNVKTEQAYAVAGPLAWNSFLDYLWASDCSGDDSFKHLLNTYLFERY